MTPKIETSPVDVSVEEVCPECGGTKRIDVPYARMETAGFDAWINVPCPRCTPHEKEESNARD